MFFLKHGKTIFLQVVPCKFNARILAYGPNKWMKVMGRQMHDPVTLVYESFHHIYLDQIGSTIVMCGFY
jgi:hypothetical protein